ncbi:MAG TPA: hypothetical protein VGQ81_11835 [Acidobacteriota bacterium]|nr:hypothetical protein [Acidobacteriota bacterium]
MTFEQLLVFFLVIVALSCVFQTVAMLIIVSRFSRRLDAVVDRLERLQASAGSAIDQMSTALSDVRPLVGAIQDFERQSARFFEKSAVHVRKTEERIDNTLQLGREKLSDLNRSVGQTLDRMQDATSDVQQLVLRPSAEAAAVVKGVRRAVQAYLKKQVAGR